MAIIDYDHNSKIASTIQFALFQLLCWKLCDHNELNEVGPKICCNCMIFNVSSILIATFSWKNKTYLFPYIIDIQRVRSHCEHDGSFGLALPGHGQFLLIIHLICMVSVCVHVLLYGSPSSGPLEFYACASFHAFVWNTFIIIVIVAFIPTVVS